MKSLKSLQMQLLDYLKLKYDLAYKGLSSFGYETWYGEYASTNTNFKNISQTQNKLWWVEQEVSWNFWWKKEIQFLQNYKIRTRKLLKLKPIHI